MTLKEFVLSDSNIYWAIYSLDSYVFDKELLSKDDRALYDKLRDPFNYREKEEREEETKEDTIDEVIKDVQRKINSVLNGDDYFETEVYFKPKKYDEDEENEEDKRKYRPIHTAKLNSLIAMVAMLHPLVYDISLENDEPQEIRLSNYSKLIPHEFYGNRVSLQPEKLFKSWNEQYKAYQKKTSDYLLKYKETGEYDYEVKLDFKNFFPSVSPLVIYGILVKYMPATYSEEDADTLKKIILKLLVCCVKNLETEKTKRLYYGDKIPEGDKSLTRGIPQGLPQSYFFGNICMIENAKEIKKVFGGEAVYYVDDVYLYINKNKELDSEKEQNEEEEKERPRWFKKSLENAEKSIQSMSQNFFDRAKQELLLAKFVQKEILDQENDDIKFNQDKCAIEDISGIKNMDAVLMLLTREASKIGGEFFSTYSDEEDIVLLRRTEAMLKLVESKIREEKGKNCVPEHRLMGYKKFFKYRCLKLKIKLGVFTSKELIGILRMEDVDKENWEESKRSLKKRYEDLGKKGLPPKDFFEMYTEDIWGAALQMLIQNTITGHEDITKYLDKIESDDGLGACSYVRRSYKTYKDTGMPECHIVDVYGTLKRKMKRKLSYYAKQNTKNLKEKFDGMRFVELENDCIGTYNILGSDFKDATKIVRKNSDNLERMFLNALYSHMFKVEISDSPVVNHYGRHGLSYGQLRALVYLRNMRCNVTKFLDSKINIMGKENHHMIDMAILTVLPVFKRYLKNPEYVDNLIVLHKYTVDIWKNGAKHLYFYTLHNEEHAIVLVKNIVKLMKFLSSFQITDYDYYLLFMACYLHDISMVRIATMEDFVCDYKDSEKITFDMVKKFKEASNFHEQKKAAVDTYKRIDEFYENKIRVPHATDSAMQIRTDPDLDFIDKSAREFVAKISEGHGFNEKDIYMKKGIAQNSLVSLKYDQILLRLADLLDMSEQRVSLPILRHNLKNMSPLSAFHWLSHILTEGYDLDVQFDLKDEDQTDSDRDDSLFKERITMKVYVTLSQFTKEDREKCEFCSLEEGSLSEKGFTLNMTDNGCGQEECNFVCKWFVKKNNYLINELNALQAYLSRTPKNGKFYDTEIIIKVCVNDGENLTSEEFDILKNEL